METYLPFLDGYQMSREEKEDLIRTVWSFLESYADQAFGLHPAQQIGGYSEDFNLRSQAEFLDSKDNRKQQQK